MASLLPLLLTVLSITLPIATSANDPDTVSRWFSNLPNVKQRLTKLHFYFHDIVSGPNPTAVSVAQANSTGSSPTAFGLVRVIDNALRAGPERDSKVVGRAQGIYVAADLTKIGLLMTHNYVFEDGSTVSVVGHNPVLDTYREIPIVGGSGKFRLARGVATAKTVWFNVSSQDAVVEYNVNILHY